MEATGKGVLFSALSLSSTRLPLPFDFLLFQSLMMMTDGARVLYPLVLSFRGRMGENNEKGGILWEILGRGES